MVAGLDFGHHNFASFCGYFSALQKKVLKSSLIYNYTFLILLMKSLISKYFFENYEEYPLHFYYYS